MGWLLGYTLGSIAASFVVVRIFDFVVSSVVSEATSAAASAARPAVFIGTWAAVTAKSGMSGVTKSARRLRLKNGIVKNKLDTLTKDEQR